MNNDCENCGAFACTGKKCENCAITDLKSNLESQKTKPTLDVFMSDLKARETANTIEDCISTKCSRVRLQARGRHNSKAIDVLEILKRDLNITSTKITSRTDVLSNNSGKDQNISALNIIAELGESK